MKFVLRFHLLPIICETKVTSRMNKDPLKLREIVLNTRKPIVLRNFNTQWPCIGESLEEWLVRFDKSATLSEMEFEQMPVNSNTPHPQWEREHKAVKMTMQQFFKQHTNRIQNHWTALNYKTPDVIPKECKDGIDFSCFGFPHILEDYARFWLSSPGANTPCHKDTYGCNVVVQVYGSKSWLLFPPNTLLTTTRLPYEESSIYCLENFYAPGPEQMKRLEHFNNEAYICELNAGDVLIVPRQWWHFVETIEISLSVNAWIPLEVDTEAQLQECIVKYLIESIVKEENSAVKNYLLNPNQQELSTEDDILNILSFLCDALSSENEKKTKKNNIIYPYQYLEEEKIEFLLKEISNASFVEKASVSEYEGLIKRNGARFVYTPKAVKASPVNNIKEALINSICCETVVKEIVNEFRARYKQTTD